MRSFLTQLKGLNKKERFPVARKTFLLEEASAENLFDDSQPVAVAHFFQISICKTDGA